MTEAAMPRGTAGGLSFPAGCDCLCHGTRGVPGDGYSYVWRDDRDIMHEDWIDCHCGCPREAR